MTSGIVSTPVIARTLTPGGTCTSKVLVFCAAVDIVPGTDVVSACAGAGGTASTAAGRVSTAAVNAHAPPRR
jgi:hypothetical protein